MGGNELLLQRRACVHRCLQPTTDPLNSGRELRVGAARNGECEWCLIPPAFAQHALQFAFSKQGRIECEGRPRPLYCIKQIGVGRVETAVAFFDVLREPVVKNTLAITPPPPEAKAEAEQSEKSLTVVLKKKRHSACEARGVLAEPTNNLS